MIKITFGADNDHYHVKCWTFLWFLPKAFCLFCFQYFHKNWHTFWPNRNITVVGTSLTCQWMFVGVGRVGIPFLILHSHIILFTSLAGKVHGIPMATHQPYSWHSHNNSIFFILHFQENLCGAVLIHRLLMVVGRDSKANGCKWLCDSRFWLRCGNPNSLKNSTGVKPG